MPENPQQSPILDYRGPAPAEPPRQTIVHLGKTQWWALATGVLAAVVGLLAIALSRIQGAEEARSGSGTIVFFAGLWYVIARCDADRATRAEARIHMAFVSALAVVASYMAGMEWDYSRPAAGQLRLEVKFLFLIAVIACWFALARWLARRGAAPI